MFVGLDDGFVLALPFSDTGFGFRDGNVVEKIECLRVLYKHSCAWSERVEKELTKVFDEFEVIVILSITFKIISPLVESVH